MSSIQKTKFHHGRLKEALLQASLDLLDQSGPDAITIREIARRAGVSHAAPVNHFRDRKALLTALAVDLFGDLNRAIRQNLGGNNESGPERVKSFADTLIAYGLKFPNRYRLLWRRDLVDNEDERLIATMNSIYDDLLGEIDTQQEKPVVDRHTVAIGLWSMAHGYVSMRLDGNFLPATDKVTGQTRQNAMLAAFMQGVCR